MSPRIGERLSRWYLPRYAARGVYERMAKHRVDFLTAGVWQSLSSDAPFSLRNHRVAISYSTPESSSLTSEEIDRKRVVSGKSVSVRVELGGRRIIRKKKKTT